MNKKSKVNVVIVDEAPAIGKPQMMGAIRSREEAEHWAEKNGYTTVYLWLRRERVYADKKTKAVDVLAQQVLSKSARLVEMAETGNVWAEFMYCLALVLIVLFFACNDWPW